MGEHKYNPNCEKSKNGELPPKKPVMSKRQFERLMYDRLQKKIMSPFGFNEIERYYR